MISAIFTGILAWLQGVIVPVLIQFGLWIAAGAAAVLGFLFSASIRKYTIAAIAVGLLLGVTWLNGYLAGSGHRDTDICSNPHFHQFTLPAGKYPKSVLNQAVEHNNLGESLGCWTNANIR